MSKSKIEWTDETWNPVTGCTKVSAGCKYCYAERQWPRLSAPGQPYEGRTFTDVHCHEERLYQPLHWKRPRRVFVNSMSDLFHEDIPDSFIDRIFGVMWEAKEHTFQILTKRAKRMAKYMSRKDLMTTHLPHVWLGVSAEDQQTANERMPLLLQTPAAVRFVSLEPLLGPIKLGMEKFIYEGRTFSTGPDWVIVGGESGPDARPMHPDWVRSIRDECVAGGTPFFFKQWGEWAPNPTGIGPFWTTMVKGYKAGNNDTPGYRKTMYRVGKRTAGRELDGRTWDEYPWT